MEKIKIAQIIGNSSCGGVISCLMNYYRHIDREVVRFDFYTYGPSSYDEEIKALGGEVHYFPTVFNFGPSVAELTKQLKGYDAVHVHMTTLSFVGLMAAKNAGVPVRICHSHSTTDTKDGLKLVVKDVLRYPTRFFATHEMGCSERSNRWLFGKGNDAKLLHNAIDLERFSPCKNRAALRKKYGLENNFVYGFIGRFETQKNVPFLIKAFAVVAQRRPDSKLVLVGDGSQKQKVLSLIKENGLDEKVLILPDCSQVEKYYALFDLFVLPSIFEGLPLVAVEAQAMKLPCLLSDHITAETAVGGVCKFSSIDKPERWAEAMLQAASLHGVECHRAMRENGYDIRTEAPKLLEWYKEIIKK
ncbi:MAG: glycosyltransferase [Clostridia bacterium]|nr:glycosyltransferase [Clostridia bacterium]